jgi:hypothetical protein
MMANRQPCKLNEADECHIQIGPVYLQYSTQLLKFSTWGSIRMARTHRSARAHPTPTPTLETNFSHTHTRTHAHTHTRTTEHQTVQYLLIPHAIPRYAIRRNITSSNKHQPHKSVLIQVHPWVMDEMEERGATSSPLEEYLSTRGPTQILKPFVWCRDFAIVDPSLLQVQAS